MHGPSAASRMLCARRSEVALTRVGPNQSVVPNMGTAYARATTEEAPHAIQCVDAFHVVKLANEAIDKSR